MSQLNYASYEVAPTLAHEATLDLVVPFTTPALTRAALRAADKLGAGLNSSVRILRLQTVPFPLQLNEPPVIMDFMNEQLSNLHSALPVRCQIVLTRDFEVALEDALAPQSLVVLANRRRPWKTRTERLAGHLTRNGHKVVLVNEEEDIDA